MLMKLQSGRLNRQAADEAGKDRVLMTLQSERLKGQGANEASVWKAERTGC